MDTSDSSRIKSDRGYQHRGVLPELATRAAADRPVKDRKHPLYRCSDRTYLGNRLSHQAGLSIREIAGATGLSSSRIHQLLNAPEAMEIPVWLSQLRQSKPRRWPQSSYDGSGASQVTKHTKLSEGCRVLLSTRHPLGLVFEPARVSQNSRIEHVNAVDKGPFRDGQYGH